jgi:hypothetical protein
MYNNNTINQHEQIDTPMYPVWIRLLLKRMGFWNCDIPPTFDTIRVEFEPISQFVLICVCVTFIEEMRLWFLPCLSAHKN